MHKITNLRLYPVLNVFEIFHCPKKLGLLSYIVRVKSFMIYFAFISKSCGPQNIIVKHFGNHEYYSMKHRNF